LAEAVPAPRGEVFAVTTGALGENRPIRFELERAKGREKYQSARSIRISKNRARRLGRIGGTGDERAWFYNDQKR